MQLNNFFIKRCPCCHKTITFKELFSAWSLASKNSDKKVICHSCKKQIQNLLIYEKYALLGALPLFGIPLFYSNDYLAYIVAFGSLIYGIILFWLLYMKIPLVCKGYEMNINEKETQNEIKKDSSINQYVVGIIAIAFFISIISMFLSFANTMKEKNRQDKIITKQNE
jgi:uncharacterized oligopeptide transporter (OPT) family protein